MVSMIEVSGVRYCVADEGRGPAMLFVHGFPLDHTMWRHQLAQLTSDFRCLAPDLRGFGKSTVTAGTVTMEQFADDLAALLDALHISEPIVFCGLSMGGYIAWQFARRHSDRLKALILCDTRAVADTDEAAANRLKLANDVLQQGPRIVADAMLPRLFAPGTVQTRPEILEETRQVILATSPAGIAAALRGMAQRPDARPWLPAISWPTLLLAGEHDAISTPDEMSDFARSISNARLAIIPDAGHMTALENADAVTLAVRDFGTVIRSMSEGGTP